MTSEGPDRVKSYMTFTLKIINNQRYEIIITLRCHFKPTELAKIRKLDNAKDCWDVDRSGFLTVPQCHWNLKWHGLVWRTLRSIN